MRSSLLRVSCLLAVMTCVPAAAQAVVIDDVPVIRKPPRKPGKRRSKRKPRRKGRKS